MLERAGWCALAIMIVGCGSSSTNTETPDASSPEVDAAPSSPSTFEIALVPDGATGMQRVNFAIPFARGQMTDPQTIKILVAGAEVPAARRALAAYDDGSVRSVQIQVDVDAASLTVDIGSASTAAALTMVDVATTVTGNGNNVHPKVWAVLPTSVLLGSGLGGPLVARASLSAPLDAWNLCDYDAWDTTNFLVNASSSRDVWLYDRVTAMYRGYFTTGELSPLRSAYREAELYRAGMTITNGVATAIAPPTANDDLKYYYAQNMALHFLLTGDDRFREAAEAVSARIAMMWNPTYDGTDKFWTERHAGFTLLAHEWALAVTDDKAQAIAARSETAVTAYLEAQAHYPSNYTDTAARCFGHSAAAHGEDFGYNGCSPWMSALIAEGLDEYARRIGGTRADTVRSSLAMLGRSLARDGRDSTGKPFYWMGEGNTLDEVDPYDEHWGESAYVIALAWNATGRTEPALKTAADELVAGFKAHGEIGQTRSFNWQCRAAVATPALLK